MPDLLFELFSEEIPARMQKQASEDLKRLVTNALVEAGVTYEGAQAYATPRRLALHVVGLPARQPDTREERKGPRVGAPDGAVQGFLKAAGLASLDQAKIESDPKKGEFYVAVIEKPGRPTLDLLAEILPATIRAFPWPKSMRWGAASTSSASLRWVRPLRAILATFGAETEEPEIVPFAVDGLAAGSITYGHRFMAPAEIRVKRFEDYAAKLEAAKVVLDPARRKEIIRQDARNLAFAQGLEVVEDEGLLEEVAGLVEWPVVLMGRFEDAFLDVPGEVIRATIRANQKCFVLRNPSPPGGGAAEAMGARIPSPPGGGAAEAMGARIPSPPGGEGAASAADEGGSARAGGSSLSNRFLLVSNIEAKDGGATIIAGNERVIRARLSDAKFFWETDKKVWREDKGFTRLERFKNVTFHEKLGSQWERIERIRALAKELCAVTGADPAKVDLAARICKLDLQTEVVGEFPEVQGLMGRIYAGQIGLDPSVAAACEEHYKPVGPGDSVPKDPVSVTVALADKLDTLVGFWAIDEKPTGSKDPYALRRAALGVIRLVVENRHSFKLTHGIWWALIRHFTVRDNEALVSLNRAFADGRVSSDGPGVLHLIEDVAGPIWTKFCPNDSQAFQDIVLGFRLIFLFWERYIHLNSQSLLVSEEDEGWYHVNLVTEYIRYDLLSFFHDRLKVMLRDSGARHDLVDAVLGNGEANDDLLLVVQRVNALGRFLETEDGTSLLAGFKRAANILRAEEKKDGEGAFEAAADPALCREASEKALLEALSKAGEAAGIALGKADFEAAMRAMAALRGPVDAFFEAVMVNAEEPAIRRNRLALLATLRRVTRQVADFSRIAG